MAVRQKPPLQRFWVPLGACVAAGVLGGVFLLYTRPDFLVQLTNQLWACF